MMDIQNLPHRLVLAALLSLLAAPAVMAQSDTGVARPLTRVSIGPAGGYGAHLYLGRIDLCETPEVNAGRECGVLQSGSGTATSLGAALRYRLADRSGVALRLLYESNSGSMSVAAPGATETRAPDGTLREIRSVQRLAFDMTLLTLELLWTATPFDLPIEVSAGPKVSLGTGGRYEAREELPESAGVSFVGTGTTVRSYGEGTFAGALQVGVTAGAAWMLPLSRTITLLPGIDLWGYLTNVVPFGSARMLGARATATAFYTIPTPAPAPPPPPPPIPPPPAAIASLRADVRGFGLTDESLPKEVVTIKVEESVGQGMVPLLPYVFFSKDAVDVPERYVVPSNMPRSALELYYGLLPTVGRRMLEHPSARLRLLAGHSDDELPTVARSRAETISSYLTSRWGIDPGRIEIRTHRPTRRATNESLEQSRQESRHVRLIADAPILDPLALSSIDTRISSPGVRFTLDIEAAAGLKSWNLEFGFGGSVVRRLRGGVSYSPMIDERFTSSELTRIVADGARSIDYSLRVLDSAGSEYATALGSIPVQIRRTDDTSLMRGPGVPAATVLFEYNSHALTPAARTALDSLRSRLPRNARLEIVGYADETGTNEHNLALSQARARAVSAALSGFESTTEGVGEVVERYSNALPEGRYYSRSATVRILD